MGFVIVADVASKRSFDVAYALIDRIFDRLQFDISDTMTCPVAIVLVGNKADLRGHRREVDPEAMLRREVEGRYFNRAAEPRFSVEYVECSAQTNSGLQRVMLLALARIRVLPSRSRIRSARMRATGFFAKFKRELCTCCPYCFEVEECFKYTDRGLIRPCVKRLGLYAVLCECAPLVFVYRTIARLVSQFLSFRWLCDWCPPFVLRLRKEVSADEEDADLEKDAPKQDDDGS